jgi:hypothetical protein
MLIYASQQEISIKCYSSILGLRKDYSYLSTIPAPSPVNGAVRLPGKSLAELSDRAAKGALRSGSSRFGPRG